jgi:hypothetical protein
MELEHIAKLSKDLKLASRQLGPQEARYLVDAYYIIQEDRKRSNNQVRAMGSEPSDVLAWFAEQNTRLENQIKVSLDVYSYNHPMGSWMRATKGIGPVIAAGLLAHLSIYHPGKLPDGTPMLDAEGKPVMVPTETVGHWWTFAGLDPSKTWEKGQKRPWNASLKVLLWKAGDSFVKVSGGENPGYYGTVYRTRKAYEIENNEAGKLAGEAARALSRKKFSKDTEAYKAYSQGKLPPAHLDARARRYAVKLFLSHLHHEWYVHEFKKTPPMPYPIAHLGHVHFIEPPLRKAA